MQEITTIGLDIAKSVFQVHGIDASGAVIVRQRPSATSAHEPRLLSSACRGTLREAPMTTRRFPAPWRVTAHCRECR